MRGESLQSFQSSANLFHVSILRFHVPYGEFPLIYGEGRTCVLLASSTTMERQCQRSKIVKGEAAESDQYQIQARMRRQMLDVLQIPSLPRGV